ncbi:MAG: YbaB/EbfC family nucleoid-associated protein [Microthrixaceae bacterium]
MNSESADSSSDAPSDDQSSSSQGSPSPLGQGLDLGSMMQMAQSMQEQVALAQQELADTEVVGTSGGGVVTVTLNGHLHLKKVHIAPDAVDADDPSMVEDLILAAWQDAHDQVAVLQAQADPMSGLLGGGGLGDLGGGAGLGDLGGLGGLLGGA